MISTSKIPLFIVKSAQLGVLVKGYCLIPRTDGVTSFQVNLMLRFFLSVEKFLLTRGLSVDRKMLSNQLKSLGLILKRKTRRERKMI